MKSETANDKERAFFDDKAVHSGDKDCSTADRTRIRRRAKSIVEAAGIKKGMQVLELGCGTGAYTREFGELPIQLVAVDLSSEMVRLAESATGPNVTCCVADGAALPFEAGRFDAVIGNGVLHHFPDLQSILAEIRRVKTDTAPIVFREPNFFNPRLFMVFGLPFMRSYREKHWSPNEQPFSRAFIRQALLDAGYSRVSVRYAGLVPQGCPHAISPLLFSMEKCISAVPLIRALMGSLIIKAF